MGGGGKGGGGGGGATSTINVNNSGTTNVDSDSTVEIKGLDNIKTTTELILPQPFKTESRQEIAVTEPIVSDAKSSMALDIRPMTVDLCLNLNTGPIPSTCIRQPYHNHFGFTLFGQELFGFSFSGESQVIVQDVPKQPQVAWGGEEPSGHRPKATVVGPKETRSGLRIRVGT